MKEILRYKKCFVCGDENEHGLQLKFYYDGTRSLTQLKADDMFEGYRGIYHGGIISTLLDEIMVKVLLAEGVTAVTAEMTVRYRRPVRTGDTIKLAGWRTGQRGRVYYTGGEAVDGNGEPFATATGKYIQAEGELREELKRSLD